MSEVPLYMCRGDGGRPRRDARDERAAQGRREGGREWERERKTEHSLDDVAAEVSILNHTPHSLEPQPYNLHPTPLTLNLELRTLHTASCTPNPEPSQCTPNSKPRTPRPKSYTLDPKQTNKSLSLTTA